MRTHGDTIRGGQVAKLVVTIECLLGEPERGRNGGLKWAASAGLVCQSGVDMVHGRYYHGQVRCVA